MLRRSRIIAQRSTRINLSLIFISYNKVTKEKKKERELTRAIIPCLLRFFHFSIRDFAKRFARSARRFVHYTFTIRLPFTVYRLPFLELDESIKKIHRTGKENSRQEQGTRGKIRMQLDRNDDSGARAILALTIRSR